MTHWAYTIFILGAFALGMFIGIYKGQSNSYETFRKLEISPQDIQLSEARLKVLWLSKTLENICDTPDMPDCCRAERWRKDANKWAKEVIEERIKEKTK